MAEKLSTEREEFVEFISLTRERRAELGLPLTQRDWAKVHKIHEQTISQWKTEPAIYARLRQLRENYVRSQLPKVDAALVRKAVKSGNYYESKLLYQRFDDFRESSDAKLELSGTVTLSQWLQSDESTTVPGKDENSASLVS